MILQLNGPLDNTILFQALTEYRVIRLTPTVEDYILRRYSPAESYGVEWLSNKRARVAKNLEIAAAMLDSVRNEETQLEYDDYGRLMLHSALHELTYRTLNRSLRDQIEAIRDRLG